VPQIVIYETTHFENIPTLVELFGLPGNRITIFCSREAWLQCKHLPPIVQVNPEWQLQDDDMSRRAFLQQLWRWLEPSKVDLLIVNTASDNFWKLAAICRKMRNRRVLLTVHAIQAYFSPQLNFNFRRIVRVTGKWILRRNVKEYIVHSRAMLPAMRRNLPASVPVHWIPGAISGTATRAIPSFPLHLVIAGSVDARRRRYEELFQWLPLVDFPLKITLLGGSDNENAKTLIGKLAAVANSQVGIATYAKDAIPQEEYDAALSEAHFIYQPSVEQTILEDGAVETYGLTVNSGVFGDACRHLLPIIIPSGLNVDPVYEHMAFRYQNVAELVSFLRSIRDMQVYECWQQKAFELKTHLSAEKIRAYTPALFGLRGG
jgi:hypothetical protein